MNAEIVSYGSSASGSSGSSISLSATIPNGNNRTILVFVASEDSPSNANITPSSVTFNGVAMTLVTSSELNNTPTNNVKGLLYKITGNNVPPAGTYNIVSTFPGSIKSRGILYVCIKNAARIEPIPEASGVNTTTGNTIGVGFSSLSPNALMIIFAMSQNLGGYTPGSGQTSIDQISGSGNEITVGASYKVVSSPVYTLLTMTHSNGERQSSIMASVAYYDETQGAIL